MISLLSPAKTLNENDISLKDTFEETYKDGNITTDTPFMINAVSSLVKEVSVLSKEELGRVLKTNAKLTKLNFERFQSFGKAPERVCGLAFDGPSFKGVDMQSIGIDEMEYFCSSTIVLSGLYGFLSLKTLLKPYRLDVANKVNGNILYDYWQKKEMTKELCTWMKRNDKTQIISLASGEYDKMIDREVLQENNIQYVEAKISAPSKGRLGSHDMKFFRGKIARTIALLQKKTLEELCKVDDEDFSFSLKESILHVTVKNYVAAKKRKI